MSDPQNYRRVLAARPDPPMTAPPVDDAPATALPAPLDRVRIEVEQGPGSEGNTGPIEAFERFTARVDELGAAIAGMADRLRTSLEANRPPDAPGRWSMSQVSMEFGLNLEAETGIVIYKGKTAAAFKVSITWTQQPAP
jgi:hypothetical protein